MTRSQDRRRSRRTTHILDAARSGADLLGVCEVPGWGVQLPPDSVLGDAVARHCARPRRARTDTSATSRAMRALLERHGLELVGGFLPVVLHDPDARRDARRASHRAAELFAAARRRRPRLRRGRRRRAGRRGPARRRRSGSASSTASRASTRSLPAHGAHAVAPSALGTLVERGTTSSGSSRVATSASASTPGISCSAAPTPSGSRAPQARRIAHVHLKDVARPIAAGLRAGELDLVPAVQPGSSSRSATGEAPVAERRERSSEPATGLVRPRAGHARSRRRTSRRGRARRRRPAEHRVPDRRTCRPDGRE